MGNSPSKDAPINSSVTPTTTGGVSLDTEDGDDPSSSGCSGISAKQQQQLQQHRHERQHHQQYQRSSNKSPQSLQDSQAYATTFDEILSSSSVNANSSPSLKRATSSSKKHHRRLVTAAKPSAPAVDTTPPITITSASSASTQGGSVRSDTLATSVAALSLSSVSTTGSMSQASSSSSPGSSPSSLEGDLKNGSGTPKKSSRYSMINDYIRRLIAVKSKSCASRPFCLSNAEISTICQAATSVFMAQPVFLELGTPVKVVGDVHGQFSDLMKIFDLCGMPPKSNYLFLGDYVDRGKQSLETIMLLLCLKIRFPENVFLLRGNHECASVTKVYGFYDECKRRSSVKVWKSIVDVFNTLPIAATIGGKIFCVHGGLSPSLKSMDDIQTIQRPTDIPDTGLISDLLWSDPDQNVRQWSENDRGVSYCFGASVVDRFCKSFGFDLICRGHMVVEDGYEFFDRRKLVTVFSAPNYCGEFGNWGAVMSVTKDLLCSFDLIKPKAKKKDIQGSKRM